ncbi:MAG: MmcQ/YjbR family DNA-binding protein [Acidimicrobiales bacterium]
MATKGQRARQKLVAGALGFPETWEDHPWEETVVKVGKKVFVFCGGATPDDPPITLKLRESLEESIGLGAEPAGYGLGRSGWVTVTCSKVPVEILEDWVEESYRIVAPKRLSALLDQAPGPSSP